MTPTPETAVDPCPVEAVFPDQRIPCILSRGHEPPHKYTPAPAPETGTDRIRWSDDPADARHFTGHVGTVTEPAFKLYGPIDGSDRWLLSIRLKGAVDLVYRDDPDELKDEAERRLERFVSSLGASFPEDEYQFGDVRELDLEEAFGSGCYVRYQHPDAGWPGEQDDARTLLTHGRLYRVAWNDIGDSKTRIGLVGVAGAFNSVLFEPVASEDVTDEGAAEVARRPDEPAKETGQ